MNDRIQDLAQLDRLIHGPARLMIVMTLEGAGEADFLYLQRECGLTQEEAGYVEIQKTYKGKLPLTLCRLTEKGRSAFAGYSQRMLGVLRPNADADERRRD